MFTCIMVAFFVIYELGLSFFYKWAKENNQEMIVWIVLGSKVVKILLGVMWIVLVALLTDEPVVAFTLSTLLVLLLTIIYETVFFLKYGKKGNRNENEQL